MTLRINNQEFRLLRDFIGQECGIALEDNKAYLIENRLSDLAKKWGCLSFGEFYFRVKSAPPQSELRCSVVDAITTKETSWFRDQRPFEILRERILPELQQNLLTGKRKDIRIWSAACSTGEEPYSIAITALDFFRTCGGEKTCIDQVCVLATDIARTALTFAITGQYQASSIPQGMPKDLIDRYFRKEGNSRIVRDKVMKLITFQHHNLKDPVIRLGIFDVVFLRNALIYFSDKLKQEILDKITRILSPEGYLFLGSTEIMHGHNAPFEMLEDRGAIYYRLKPKK
ncbi:MAG: protein-glutamate O-methyltransferase CheR [Thermodesulfobacteriota bacterium]|nr:protein-glutamate O-methyltransferase CheR [Thermodesulfobacteriota bacterium]